MNALFTKIVARKTFVPFIIIIGICSFAGVSFGVGTSYDASTSSSVANTSPVFTAPPSDGGSSASAPTPQGSNVTFTATAKDVNGNQYYLAICKTDAVTAGNNTAPTCATSQTWAISSATSSASQATATYTTQASDPISNAWYAFVCDKVTGGGACYPASGTGDQGLAAGTITFSGIPVDGATVTVDSVIYEFDTAGNGVTGGHTSVGTSASQSGAESASPLATAEAGTSSHMAARSNVVYVYADTKGVGGNSIGMAKAGDTGSAITLSAANLAGGTDANASPFIVDHPGTLGSVTVTDTGDSASIEPGDTLKFKLAQGTITADNNINMYICSSATTAFDYSANTCTGGTLICSDTNVNPTSEDAVCQESGNNLVPVPTSHGSKGFKVYVEDVYSLPATGTNSQTYTVSDVAPVFSSYPSLPTPDFLTAGSSITYTFTVSLTDNNGDNDVTSVKGVFFDKSAVTHSCASNDNNCYINAACTLTGVGSGTDNELGASCTVTVWYNANASNWTVEAVATDGAGDHAFTDAVADLTIGALGALDVTQGSIAYGSVAIGYASAKTTTTIANMGNQSLDIILTGTDMCTDSPTCSTSGDLLPIPAAQQKWYHTNTDFNWSATTTAPGPYTLVTSNTGGLTDALGCLNRDIAVRGSDHTATTTNESIYWKLKIPDAQPIGSYSGTNTFQSTASATCTGGQSY